MLSEGVKEGVDWLAQRVKEFPDRPMKVKDNE